MAKRNNYLFIILLALTIFALGLFLTNSPFYYENSEMAYALEGYEDSNKDDPCLISNSQDLIDLATLVNDGYDTSDMYFLLTDDIVVSDFEGIGNFQNQFKGKFYGELHTITINSMTRASDDYDNIGLFGCLSNGGLIDGVIVTGNISGDNYVGGIVGRNFGTINECINEATINTKNKDNTSIGGITGENLGEISSCINLGSITGNKEVGGIVGLNNNEGVSIGDINGAINLGNISALFGTSTNVGGIIGKNKGTVKNIYNYCDITNIGSSIGSLIGYFTSETPINECYNGYNNKSKCNYPIVYNNAFSELPNNFNEYTMYDFLGNETLTFDEVMAIPEFDTGYGYMPMLSVFINNSDICDYVKHNIFETGDGTETTPFEINSIEQYNLFATNTKIANYENKYVLLNIDIYTDKMLSSSEVPFMGNFDGNDNTVNLEINLDENNLGMWKSVGSARISNLHITGYVHGHNKVGALAGVIDNAVLQNIENEAFVTGQENIGSVIGYVQNNSILQNITNIANVNGIYNVGGIAGSIINSSASILRNTGKVYCSDTQYGNNLGGIFGYAKLKTNTNKLYNGGDITANKGSNIGGIMGSYDLDTDDDLEINESMNIADILGFSKVGGLIGGINGSGNITINESAVISLLTGANNTAGFVGNYDDDINSITIQNGYFNGNLQKLPRSTIDETTFSVLCTGNVNPTIDNMYYNREVLNNECIDDSSIIVPETIQGTESISIQLTNLNNDAVHTVALPNDEEQWNIEPMEINLGIFPSLSWLNFTSEDRPEKLSYKYFESGNGTSESPLLISSAQQFYNFSYLHNNYYDTYKEKYYTQTSELVLKDEFEPIGNSQAIFNGTYDGGQYGIFNIEINGGGLFNVTDQATIKKVALSSGEINGTDYAGALVGQASNTTIVECYNLIDINIGNGMYKGGLVGELNGGTLTNSFNAGNITGTNGYIGGLVGGLINSSTIENCFNMGSIFGDSSSIGGLVGLLDSSELLSSYSNAFLQTQTNSYIAGLVANSNGAIKNCYFNGIIEKNETFDKQYALVGLINKNKPNYLYNCYYNSDFCDFLIHSQIVVISNNKSAEEMDSSEFLDSFDDNIYVSDLESDSANNYTLEIEYFANSENYIIQNYSKLSARIRIFGWDKLSQEEWGLEENPYLISNRSQLDELSNLTKTYDYTGKYFQLSNDVDMRIDGDLDIFTPIGKYVNEQDFYAFNGYFDGQGYELQYLKINEYDNYIGLFGMLGIDGSVCNLVIDENSIITGNGNYVGSLVGRNNSENGLINKVVSKATIEGNNYVGGLVGYTSNNTIITNCLYDGNISGNSHAYGLVGMSIGSVNNVNYNNSWYINRYDEEAGEYINNGYTNVLYVDKNGSVNVNYDVNRINEEFMEFILIPTNEYYEGCYMDSMDNVISNQTTIYSTYNTQLIAMYARFTLPITINKEINGDKISIPEENKRYYSGQKVELNIEFVEYGYYINIFDAEKNILADLQDFTFSNQGENLIIEFIMPETFDDIAKGKEIDLDISPIQNVMTLSADTSDYNENSHDAQATILESGNGLFEDIIFNYYYGAMHTKVNNTIDAGDYEVRARLMVAESKLSPAVFLGIESLHYMVNSLTLTPLIDSTWENAIVKEYDGLTTKENVNVTEYIDGICSMDVGDVDIFATITWDTINAGNDKNTIISDFAIQGNRGSNYTIQDIEINKSTGKILKKNIEIVLQEDKLSVVYNNQKPVMDTSAVSLSAGIGVATIDYDYALLDENMEIDSSWDYVYNVGYYRIGATINDSNYNLTLFSDNYVMEIKAIEINEIDYSGYENFVYDNTDKSTEIKGSYNTLNSGTDLVGMEYYDSNDIQMENKLESLYNAGSYIGVPVILNKNYKLADDYNVLYFEIAKANADENIIVSLTKNSYVVDEKPIITIENSQDGEIILNKINDSDRGEAEIIKDGEDYKIEFIAYGDMTFSVSEINCTNYNDRTSNEITINIVAKTIYLGVETYEYNYGDVIDNVVSYSWDKEQIDKLLNYELESIKGFLEPSTYLLSDTLLADNEYEVKIIGATSKAYKFAKSDKNKIKINKKEITISVSVDEENSKVYGSEEPEINYLVIAENENNEAHSIDKLPNGDDFEFNGKLSREPGENVGNYDINQGTFLQENNPNYKLNYEFIGKFIIMKKELKLKVPSQHKAYLENDPMFIVELEEGYEFAGDDDFSDIEINLSRIEGENIGSYTIYEDGSNGGNNYLITNINILGKFIIDKGEVNITALANQEIEWGTNVTEAVITCSANYFGEIVQGMFEWVNVDDVINFENNQSLLSFVPDDKNLLGTTTMVTFENIVPRKLQILLSGKLDYTYTGKVVDTSKINVQIRNTIDDKLPTISFDFENQPINVGNYNIYPILDNYTDIYSVGNEKIGVIHIYPAVVNVKISGGEFYKDEELNLDISYEGFVNGEDESVLDTLAYIKNIPSEVGYYNISPIGAKAKNYSFNYGTVVVSIKNESLQKENIKITGDFAPEVSLEIITQKVDSIEAGVVQKNIDKALNVSLINPNTKQMVEYYRVELEGELKEDTVYEMSFENKINENTVFYVTNDKGEVSKISDYEVIDDEKILFESSNISSISMYQEKDTLSIIVFYLPYVGGLIGVVAIIVLFVLINKKKKKKEEAMRRKYLR